MQRPGKYVFAGCGEAYMGRAHAPPTTVDREKNVRQFFDKFGLLLRS